MWLTPSERRALAMVVAILLAGVGWDSWRAWTARSAAVRGPGEAPAASDPMDTAPGSPPSPGPGWIRATGERPGSPVLRLDLNRATVADLDALPGIGPVLARRIVARRSSAGPYRRPEDLLGVQGIGPRLLERLRARIEVADGGPPGPVHSASPESLRRADSPSGGAAPSR